MTMKQPFWRLARGTLIYGTGGILSRFIGFLLLPVFTSYLTPADFGISSMLGFIGFFLTPVFSLGLGASMGVCYFEGNDRERKETTLWSSFTMLGLSVSLLAVLGCAFAKEISLLAFRTPQYHYLVAISVLSTCLTILNIPFMLYFQFEERAKAFVVLTTFSTLTGIGLSIFMVVFLGRGIQGLIESVLIGQAVTLLVFLIPVIPVVRYRFSRTLSHGILKLGVPLIPSFAFLFVIQQGNKYILQWVDGLDTVGIYTVGLNLGLMMNLIVSGFTSAWMPYFMSFNNKWKEARLLFGRVLTYYVFSFGGLSLLFYITARPVVMIMTKTAFHDAYKVVGLSATAQFLTGVFSIFLPAMYFAKEVRYVTLIQGISAFLAVVLNLLLVLWMGMLGSAIGLVLGVLVMNILQHAWNLKQKNCYLNVQYEWSRILWFSVFYLGYIIIMLLKPNFSLVIELFISGSAVAMLPIFLYALLNNEEREVVEKIRKRLRQKISLFSFCGSIDSKTRKWEL
jgi:O-antigen/teichoic acid export membrane protein